MPMILSAEYPLHVETSGDDRRPCLLLLNPLGTTLEYWEPMLETFEERNWVVRFDIRGHGRSAGETGEFNIAALVADALAVLDALEVPRAHVLGDSMGALVAAVLASDHPGRVDRLVLASCGVHLGNHVWWGDVANTVQESGMRDVADKLEEAYFSEEWRQAVPELAEAARAMFLSVDPDVFVTGALLLKDLSLEGIDGRIQASTLLIGGEQDPFFKHYPITDLLSMIPSSEAVNASGARHRVLLEQPDLLSSVINEFLSDPDAR